MLMGRLAQTIRERNRTAIIVSHNIDLMEEFADVLMVIQKPLKTGELLPSHIFNSQIREDGERSDTETGDSTCNREPSPRGKFFAIFVLFADCQAAAKRKRAQQ